MPHKPVLLKETIDLLALRPGQVVVDGTVGSAGHALEIVRHIGPSGKLIGLDQDPEAIERCRKALQEYPQATLHQENFKNLDRILDSLNISLVNAVILDVGVSSNQLEEAARGFSFERTGPLDMRMDPADGVSARDLIHDLSKQELERIFRDYGNERRARRFAEVIVEQRPAREIETTADLVEVLDQALPFSLRSTKERRPRHARRHPATRVFQALRIAVNRELEVLEEGLPKIWQRLAPEGRFAVMTFHSLEDRIVKNYFRRLYQEKSAERITKKPVMTSFEETKSNPRSRSARLRVVGKRH